MNDFFDNQLQRHAATMSVPPGDVEAVMARGRRRRRRQRALAGASTATAVGVLAATIIIATHHGPASTQVASTGPTQPTAPATTLTWRVVDPTSALGATTALTSSAPLYALSTAPGVADPTSARVIYRSADGLEWSQTSGPNGLYVSDLAAHGSQLYAVGTGAATAAVGGRNLPGFAVAWSADRGRTWHTRRVADRHAGDLLGHHRSSTAEINVASGAKGTVVVAALGAQLDLPRFLPAGVRVPNGWTVTATGVDLLARATATCPAGTAAPSGAPAPSGQVDVVPCMPGGTGPAAMLKRLPLTTPNAGTSATPKTLPQVGPNAVTHVGPSAVTPGTPGATALGAPFDATQVTPQAAYGVSHSYTWAQLGVSADVERAVLGAPFVYYSANGTTFTPVTLPAPAEAAGQITVVADGAGFTVAASGPLALATCSGRRTARGGQRSAPLRGAPPPPRWASSPGRSRWSARTRRASSSPCSEPMTSGRTASSTARALVGRGRSCWTGRRSARSASSC